MTKFFKCFSVILVLLFALSAQRVRFFVLPISVSADSVSDLQTQLTDTQNKLNQLQGEQDSLSTSLQKLSTDISNQQELIAKQARNAQLNNISTNFISALLDSQSMTEALQKILAMNKVIEIENFTIQKEKQNLSTYNQQLKNYQKDYQAAVSLQSQLNTEIIQAQAAQISLPAGVGVSESDGSLSSDTTSTVSIDLNQVHGTVDIAALADYMQSITGGSADMWAQIIARESRGQVDAYNASSGAVGPFQSLGHGDTQGMTLGQYCTTAARIYQLAGFYGGWQEWQ